MTRIRKRGAHPTLNVSVREDGSSQVSKVVNNFAETFEDPDESIESFAKIYRVDIKKEKENNDSMESSDDNAVRTLSLIECWSLFTALKSNFVTTYAAYFHFRDMGWVPKPGYVIRARSARISCFHHSHTHEIRVRSTKMRTRTQLSIVSSTHGISLSQKFSRSNAHSNTNTKLALRAQTQVQHGIGFCVVHEASCLRTCEFYCTSNRSLIRFILLVLDSNGKSCHTRYSKGHINV